MCRRRKAGKREGMKSIYSYRYLFTNNRIELSCIKMTYRSLNKQQKMYHIKAIKRKLECKDIHFLLLVLHSFCILDSSLRCKSEGLLL